MNTNFEGGANFNVLVKTFQKNALNAKTWPNPFFCRNMVFLVLSESSENQFGRPKKADTIFKFFLKPPPPRKNSRSAPEQNLQNFSKNRLLLPENYFCACPWRRQKSF